MPSLGGRFRAAREARGLSLSDVAEQIRIRSVYLGAIEEENWAAIGAPVYTRGFLRTYARYLGLDPEEVIAEFNGASAIEAAQAISGAMGGASADYTYAESQRRSRFLSPLIWIAGLIAIVLIAFVFYNELTMRGRTNSVAALPSSSPSLAPTQAASDLPVPSVSPGASTSPDAAASPGASTSPGPSPSPGPSITPGPSTIQVVLSAASWIRVAVDGSVSMEGTFPAGTSRVFRGKQATLRIGNAGGVDVVVDGKSVGKLGATGDVVERTFSL
jgi:cytoskeleton protein RodZ